MPWRHCSRDADWSLKSDGVPDSRVLTWALFTFPGLQEHGEPEDQRALGRRGSVVRGRHELRRRWVGGRLDLQLAPTSPGPVLGRPPMRCHTRPETTGTPGGTDGITTNSCRERTIVLLLGVAVIAARSRRSDVAPRTTCAGCSGRAHLSGEGLVRRPRSRRSRVI